MSYLKFYKQPGDKYEGDLGNLFIVIDDAKHRAVGFSIYFEKGSASGTDLESMIVQYCRNPKSLLDPYLVYQNLPKDAVRIPNDEIVGIVAAAKS